MATGGYAGDRPPVSSERNMPLINNKYKLLEQVSKGDGCTIYQGVNVQKTPVKPLCIKVEETKYAKQPTSKLHIEGKLYHMLGIEDGFPIVHSYGKDEPYNYLAMDLLGPNIEELRKANGGTFSIKCVCKMAIQMIERIEVLHDYGYVNREIKPVNFLVGRNENANTIYMCGMGSCKRFKDEHTQEHIPFQITRSTIGSLRYSSIHALNGSAQSRRDDLEALGYVLVYLAKGKLPWQGLRAQNRHHLLQLVLQSKTDTTAEDLCQDLPPEFAEFLSYTKFLKFVEEPNYDYLRNLFIRTLKELNDRYPQQPSRYDWLVEIPDKYKDIIDNDPSPFDFFDHQRPLIADNYKLTQELGRGSYCTAYLGLQVETAGEPVCIKVEKNVEGTTRPKQLYFEATLYEMLCNEEGFPFATEFGEERTFDYLAMELLGPDLQGLFVAMGRNFSFKCVCIMAIQMISRLESLHKNDFLHRDIKPGNFLIGRNKKASTLYLCDMGFCKRYRDSVTKEHIKFEKLRGMTGTPRYASINALNKMEQGRRDDLESLGYMLVYFLKGKLPWQGIKRATREQTQEDILYSKLTTSLKHELCEGLPIEFYKLLSYAKSLEFDEEPNYAYLRKLFGERLKILDKEMPMQPCRLDWLVLVPNKFVDIIDSKC